MQSMGTSTFGVITTASSLLRPDANDKASIATLNHRFGRRRVLFRRLITIAAISQVHSLIHEETNMTHTNTTSKALASGLVILLSACSVGVQAARADDSRAQVKVSYADLNLSSTQGAETLYRRIKSAAGEVCYPGEEMNLSLMAKRRACIQKAISDAVMDVGSPTLIAVYNTHEGRSQPLQVTSADKR